MNWSHFYAEGGWGMFPTTLFGVLLLLAAGVYAFRPEERFHRLLFVLGVLVAAAGMLGFTTGIITTLQYVAREVTEPDQLTRITLIGIAESANNLLLAGIAVVLACLTAGVGALRAALGSRTRAAAMAADQRST